ncbi:MAG: sugar transporter ATP-binding protein, partial [Homoserinimonas sp.]|nr:sugar transporter ATP-binding protein [Homoserinimonas sp.]
VPEFTVAENLFVGAWPTSARGVEHKQMRQAARESLARFGMDSHVNTPVRLLSPDQRQIVEIARALLKRPQVLLLDEPTATLTSAQVDTLFTILAELKEQGVSSVLVSHRLQEIYDICDRATILRDGKTIGAVDLAQCPEDELIRMMVGRSLESLYEKSDVTPGPVLLEVDGLSRGLLSNIDLTIRQGEVVGIAGLSGSGRSALARTLFGMRKPDAGNIAVMGERMQFRSPKDAIAAGLALVPENRVEQGLVLSASVRDNTLMATLKDAKPWSVLSAKKQRQKVMRYVEDLRIRTPSVEVPVSALSGGNQQKVVLAKWLAVAPKVFILDEPTQGIDIGAKADVYRLLARLVEDGCGILLISSELPELLALSDRIYTMHQGRIISCLERSEATEERIAAGMVGRSEGEQ